MRRAARKTCLILVLLVCIMPLCAGVAGKISGLKSASTEHFDIIYRDESSLTAALLFDNCEEIYASLVTLFGVDPDLHLPVVVTSEYKSLNAYYTNYTANHIVMFDTTASSGSLSNFPQTILYIFRHELTHAFQHNIRGPFFNFLSTVFGDVISLAPIFYLYPSLTEGGAVLSESMDGYGRVNSSYAMQIVKQAKLEGLFPTWYEIAGSRDTYPTGLLYYNFAAAFFEYLALTYGYDTFFSIYQEFKDIVWLPTPGKVIKEKIGISVKDAWNDFYEWVEVPETVAEGSVVESRKQTGKYSNLRLSYDGSLYAYDASTWKVLRFSEDLSSWKSILRFPTDEPGFNISHDGRLMLIPYVTDSVASVRIYNIENPANIKLVHTINSKTRDYRGGCFVMDGGVEYLLLYGNNGQITYLDLFSLDTFEAVEGRSLELGYGVTANSLTALPYEGGVAFIYNYAAQDHFAILTVSDMSLNLLENPSDLSFMSLSAGYDGSKDVLSFTWYPSDAKASNLGRYGELSLSDGVWSMRLSSTDVLGSMVGNIRLGDTIVFPVQYFERSDLRTIETESLEFNDCVNLGFEEPSVARNPDTSSLFAASGKYHAIKYFADGILLPFASVSMGSESDIGLGATWITEDPTETYTHMISLGYSFGNVLASYLFSSSNLIIPYTVQFDAKFGTGADTSPEYSLPAGAVLAVAGLSASYSYPLRHENETISVQDSYKFAMLSAPDMEFDYAQGNYLGLGYNLAFRTGTNPYDVFQFSVEGYLNWNLPGVTLGMRFPRLLWWRCDGPNITNIPFAFAVDASYEDMDHNPVIKGAASFILYSREIQRSLSFMGLYFQRFVLSSSYEISYELGQDSLSSHTASATAVFYMSPVIGSGLTRSQFGLGVTVEKNLMADWADDWNVKLALGTDF